MAADLVGPLLVASVVIPLLAAILVFLRLWIRWRLGNLGVDDYMVALSWALLTNMCILTILASQDGGLGHQRATVNDEDYETYLRYNVGISSSFSFGVAAAKISFAILYLRILPQRFLMILNKILIAFLVCQAIEESLITIFKCTPVQASFHVDIEGKCLDLRIMWWFTFVFNMSTDLILFIQPIPSVWRLQMAKAKRVGIVAMLSLGLLVCIISIVRIVHVTRIHEDETYRIAEAMIWSEVEMAALLICSCIPSLRQVVAQIPWLNQAFGLSTNKTSEAKYDRSKQKGDSIPLHNYSRQDYLPSERSRRFGDRSSGGNFGTSSAAVAGTGSNNDSQEEIFPHKTDGNGAIMVTREVTHDVEYDTTRTQSSMTDSVQNGDKIEPADRTT